MSIFLAYAIAAIITAGWAVLGYFLIKKKPGQFMRQPFRYILMFAACLTAWLIWQDVKDEGSPGMPFYGAAFEVTVYGTAYTLIFFILFCGVNFIAEKIWRN
jgi:hypothetical protein